MRRAPILLVSLLVTALLGSAASAQPSGPVLDQPRHGSDAVRKLGDRLAAVAAANDTTPAVLRARLEGDDSLWVDVQGRLFYVDPAAPDHVETGEEPVLSTTALTQAEVFALHSRPDARRTVYLDFDGASETAGDPLGGAWGPGYTGGDGIAEPYNLPEREIGSFDSDELADIYSIWQRVAEDFAPFDIDVTTAKPAAGVIERTDEADEVYGTRVVLTSSATECGCGGVAYVGVFDYYGGSGHGYYQPALVYNEGAKYAAEAATHEAGHNLGLSHDGTRKTGYYAGHGDWAPIMGVGYYQPITQWSRGEYSGANNKEDDFVVASSNGGPLRADDSGTDALLTVGTAQSGMVERAGDIDGFGFTLSENAALTVAVDPAATSPNLDIRVTLHSEDGAVVTSTDPLSSISDDPDVATGLSAGFTAQLPPGSYRLTVVGVGAHDALSSGYSSYGSLGAYTISSSTGVYVPPPLPPETPTDLTWTVNGQSVDLTWSHSDVDDTTFELRRSTILRGKVSATTILEAAGTAYTDSPGAGTYRYEVRALNAGGTSAWSPSTDDVVVPKVRGK